jgi:rubrerythrin
MSARDAELLEDEVRTLQARCAELEEDLRRTKLDAYQVALERDAAVPVAELRALYTAHVVPGTEGQSPRMTTAGRLELLAIIAAAEQRAAAAAKPARPNWQCSGCGWGFDGAWKKVCPCCDREDYWTGSVFPGALRWDGSRGTSVPHRGQP